MNSQTFLLRQVNPSWVQAGRPTSQLFRPTPKDENQVSVYDNDLVSAEEAWRHFTQKLNCASVGVLAVTVEECAEQALPARPDPQEEPGHAAHAVIDFAAVPSDGERKRKAAVLRDRAETRGWVWRRE